MVVFCFSFCLLLLFFFCASVEVNEGCFFPASPPCTGMSTQTYWTVAAAFWAPSWPSILQRLPFTAHRVCFASHKYEPCCVFDSSLEFQPVQSKVATFPQHHIFIWICSVLIQLQLSSTAPSTSPCLEKRWTCVLERFLCVFVEFAWQGGREPP